MTRAALTLAVDLPANASVLLVGGTASDVLSGLALANARTLRLVLARDEHPHTLAALERVGITHQLAAGTARERRIGTPQTPTAAEVVLFSSGTSGTPKAALHGLNRLADSVRIPNGVDADDGWMLTFNPSTYAGLQTLLTAGLAGCRLIDVFGIGIADVAAFSARSGATHASATPTFWRAFLAASSFEKPPLRQITLGGEAVDQAILDALRAAFPTARLTHIYASTEAGYVFSVQDGRAGFPASWLSDPDPRVRIEGEMLMVRAMSRMERYLGALSPFEGDWVRTGDLVQVKGERVVFLGREDTMLNVGGNKVSPEAVEDVLLSVGVSDAHVYGIPNPITGKLVAADVSWHRARTRRELASC
ncbi:MAG: acyl--CoA ligase [Acidobacteria bacterium]|nr:acyl--CoA ligase [Acidobacteriota bacterium]